MPRAARVMNTISNTNTETHLKSGLFPYLLLLSGFAGISYELLYARMLGNIIGDQWLVSAVILLTFLLGIGIGTRFAYRLWAYLWMIEIGIGLFAAGFAFSGDLIESWFYNHHFESTQGMSATLIQSFLLLLPPALLIGCGLPLFAGYLGRLKEGLAFAPAYLFHCLGAALTVLLVEFWLFRKLGLQATVLSIAGLNILIGLLLRFGYSEIRQHAPSTNQYVKLPNHQLIALVLLSIASAIFQLWLVKIGELLLGPFRETFALVLSLVLLGIALGTWLVKRFQLDFRHVVIANLMGITWMIVSLGYSSEIYAELYPHGPQNNSLLPLFKLAFLAIFAGLPAISFGATIPALITRQNNVARESGQLLFISSIANAAGFLLMLFVLHEHVSYGGLIAIIAIISALGLISYFKYQTHAILASGASVAIVLLCQQNLWNEQLLYLGYDKLHSVAKLEKAKTKIENIAPFKGYKDVFALNTMNDGHTFLYLNGYRSMDLNRPHEQIVGVMSAMFSPRTDKALVLGVGSGATAATVGLIFDQVDAIEINSVLLEKLDLMSNYNFDILNAKNINIIHDDGIRYTKASKQKYPLIINTVTTPLYFSSSKLYTLDYLHTIKQRLTPDGVYVTWVDSRIGDRGMDITLQTLRQAFEKCALSFINLEYFLLLCSDQTLALQQLDKVTKQAELNNYLIEKFSLLSNMLPYSLLSSNILNFSVDSNTPINTLDYPALEFEMAQLKRPRFKKFLERLYAHMDIDDVGSIIAKTDPSDPMLLAVFSHQMFGDSSIPKQWRSLLQQRFSDFSYRYDASLMAYYAYLAAEADTAMAHYFYAHHLIKRQRYEEALRESLIITASSPDYRDVNYFLAICYEHMGNLNQASHYYEKELSLHPDNIYALKEMGALQLKRGHPDISLDYIDKALALEENAEHYYLRADALVALGEKAAAMKTLQKSLALEPDNPLVLTKINELNTM